MVKTDDYFSPDYVTARARFREAATRAGAAVHTIGLEPPGPRGEPLAIDIAWLGAPRPRRVLLHTSGIHGIEAFTGSAVQLALLDSQPLCGSDGALVLVHVLNPYGMAWLRRTNENNVDLNRNFLVNGERWTGAPALYSTLDPLLNPASPPARDGFRIRAAAMAMRRGLSSVKQALAEGQYEYERGLFFGGRKLERGPQLYSTWIREHFANAAYVFAVDLHTGLGRRGTDTLLIEPRVSGTDTTTLATALGRKLVDPSTSSVAYTVRGGYGAALPHLLPHAQVDYVLQEIGTAPAVNVLHALREENRWHFYGDGSIVHPAKQRLFEALCPSAPEWRRRALELGETLARAAARWTFEVKERREAHKHAVAPGA